MGVKKKPNRLASEKSPYLLQHAYNPVDWYPWGEEAFGKAKKEDRPIFLSIGYSTCHWCHVMEKESFEDDEVAGLMNDTFVPIKVDREERPDIDGIYMKVCQVMTGSGGWPLNIIMTPDKKPFLSMTYVPKASMLEIIPKIRDLWKRNRDGAENLAVQVISSIKEPAGGRRDLTEDALNMAYEQLLTMFDERHGGFGDAPRFPTPHNLTFLLRYWKRTGDIMALRMVERTLYGMRMGGIFDHIGFGFHRYSTDASWVVPHFEKMLYDQALIAIAYTEAYQATGDAEFGKTAREIFTYVLRDMTSQEGGFCSGEDADSEGVEGKFYVWTAEEIRSVLGENSGLIEKIFNVDEDGNFMEEGQRTGKNILFLTKASSEIASELKMPVDGLIKKLEEARLKLFAAREKRVHPGKDDKILADWNGLMIVALARGAQVFDEPGYVEAAQRAADFVLSKMRGTDSRLYHRYRDGETAVPGFLDDYAFLIWGLIELYETTFEESYLGTAIELNDILLLYFRDEGGFYFTADDAESLIMRKKEIHDGAVPSGNSVAMLNLARLGRMTGRQELENMAADIGRTFSAGVMQMPVSYTQLMVALDFLIGPSCEVVIAGGDTKAMIRALREKFLPGTVILRPAEGVTAPAEFTGSLLSIDGKATAYVCRNRACRPPTTDPGEMLKYLDAP